MAELLDALSGLTGEADVGPGEDGGEGKFAEEAVAGSAEDYTWMLLGAGAG